MLELLAKLSTLFALVLILPALITAIMILKEYRIHSIRSAHYFKILILQGFIHSVLLALALFFVNFKTAFLIHSFGMIPLYGLLIFRKYHLIYLADARSQAIRSVSLPKKKTTLPRIDPTRLKSIRLVGQTKSRWH